MKNIIIKGKNSDAKKDFHIRYKGNLNKVWTLANNMSILVH